MQVTKTKPKDVEPGGYHFIATEGSILVAAERAVVITIGLILKSQPSARSNNWWATYARSQQLRKRTAAVLATLAPDAVRRHLHCKARTILFTRLAPRKLDDDNLATAFKPVRDQVCAWLSGDNRPNARADDGARSGYTFEYHQRQQRAYGVQIEVRP